MFDGGIDYQSESAATMKRLRSAWACGHSGSSCMNRFTLVWVTRLLALEDMQLLKTVMQSKMAKGRLQAKPYFRPLICLISTCIPSTLLT